jgi:hypothetical protein
MPISPTHFVIKMAAAERELERAHNANDIAGMQAALATKTALNRAYYGSPVAAPQR